MGEEKQEATGKRLGMRSATAVAGVASMDLLSEALVLAADCKQELPWQVDALEP